MKFFSFLTVALCLLTLSTNASAADVLATVGDKQITKEEFNKKYDEIKKQTLNPPSKSDFLEDLVRFEMGYQEAVKKGIDKSSAVQDRIKAEVYKGLLEQELSDDVAKITVNEKEMREFYKKNPEIRSSHILIEVKYGATKDERLAAERRAKEIFDDVKKSKRTFPELVKLYSDDVVTKPYGGDVGWQTRLTLTPAYYEAIQNAPQDKVIGLVETAYGFHIVKVTGRRSYEESDRRQIRMALVEVERKKLFDRYFDGLKKKYKMSVNKSALK